MTLPLLNLAETPDSSAREKAERLHGVARALQSRLADPHSVTRSLLKGLMSEAFGGSDADGHWSMRDAYDALEAAQASNMLSLGEDQNPDCPPEDAFAAILAFEKALPTQTYRSEHQVEMQQFSTPDALGWLATRAAAITADDHVLEPSAGIGMLAARAIATGASVTLNERDACRAALLALVTNSDVTTHDAEFIHDRLPPDVRPTVVLINPPFSRSEGRGEDRHAGARHLRSALLRLADGGRCVAIMSPGFAHDGSGARGYVSVAEIGRPRVEITILGRPYVKHGTGIAVRLIVFDNGWIGETERHTVDSIEAALPIVLALPPRLGSSDEPPPATPAVIPFRPALKSGSASLFSGLASPKVIAPSRIAAKDDRAEPLAYSVRDAPLPVGDPVGIYAPWRLARIDIPGATPHPDNLVESLAMASVLPPIPRYRPLFQKRASSALSDAQLEAIIYAGDAFSRDLPGRFVPNEAGDQLREDADGHAYRMGFFIGDGTGVGKGREGAAIIRDQWNCGNRRAVWISKGATLLEDARRDWTALGGLPIDIQPLDAFPLGQSIGMASGILFLTYATLRSQRHDQCSRLQQILQWAEGTFEGVILFDESHSMGNAAGTKDEYRQAKGSEQGLAGVRLQNALPRARVVYESATGATKPENLSYASRLGLWGPDTAFVNRDAFLAAMTDGGIAAMEIVARDLKSMGLYTARALSFAGVEYDPLEHRLTPDQIEIYDAYADAWAIVHQNLDEVLKASNIVDRMSGETMNAMAKGSALSRFESAKQRFFSQVLIAMKMPTVVRSIEEELAAGHVAVVQLTSTAEAILERRLAGLSPDERANLAIDVSPLDTLIDYLKTAFPTRQMRAFRSSDGALRSEPMHDGDGNAVLCQEAVEARDNLVESLCSMPPVPAALDFLIAHFGTDAVAEVTGRSRRVVIDGQGRQKLERRSASSNIAETDAFMSGRKPILVFSEAGGTGRSYHADLDCPTANKRRIHFLLEPGWRADIAIQGLGRTHRTYQWKPPVFRPVTTTCKGERRFISTIARRLDTLGALTRGQRQTGGQNLFDPADNLESSYAREALTQWYHLLHAGKLASIGLEKFQIITGLKLVDENGTLLDKLPPIQRWLNRILALRIATQDAIFEEYMGLIQARVDAAREAGTLDLGVEAIRAERIVELSQQVLREDPVSGAETRLLRLELHLKPRVTGWARLDKIWGGSADGRSLRNSRSGRVALCVPSWSITDDDGRPVKMMELVRPTGSNRIQLAGLAHTHWEEIDRKSFQSFWEAEVTEALDKVDIETISVATGLLLPVWNKLPQDDVRVWRIDDAAGTSILGRIVMPGAIEKLQSAFGLTSSIMLTPGELIEAARHGDGALIPGLHGARLVSAMVNDSRRIEIRDFRPQDREWLKARGAFSEVIAYKTRLFLPAGKADEILSTIIAEPPQ